MLREHEHEHAFQKRDDEISIPIDMSQHDFQFTRRWFNQRNRSTWSTFFPHQFPPDQPYNMVQIGVFEGMDLVWCMQNIMKHPASRVIAIDPWLATRKISQIQMDAVHERAMHNLTPWASQITIVKAESQNVALPWGAEETSPDKPLDLAIIDGDHVAHAVYLDALMCFKSSGAGTWLVFDDVRNRVKKKDHVQQGLDRFREQYPSYVNTIWQHRYCDCLEVI